MKHGRSGFDRPVALFCGLVLTAALAGCGDNNDNVLPGATATATAIATATTRPSNTPADTATATAVPTATLTTVPTHTATLTPANTATATAPSTHTATVTETATVASTATETPTQTASVTDTATATATPTPTATSVPTDTPVPGPAIISVVGTGEAGFNGDGLAPLDTSFYLPQDVTVGPDGLLYILDWNNHRVRRVRDGVIETIAGSGDIGAAMDGPALYAQFNHPTQVFFDPQGRLLIAAWHNSEIKRLDFATGLIENVAGNGGRSFGGDGGPPNQAVLNLPSSVVMDSKGNMIISDQANQRLRIVDPTGSTINTFCGTGTAGYAGDGGPAAAAELKSAVGQAAAPAGRITIDAQDRIYIADTSNHVIRLIDAAGIITTIAGTGTAGYSGDGGLAIHATLDTPSDVAVGKDGTIYIADTMNSVIRRVTTDGMISTLAGTGVGGFSGDGGPASQAQLDRPYGVDVAANGDVYVADTHNHRVRLITASTLPVQPTPHPIPTPAVIPCSNEIGTICTYAGTGEAGFNGDGRDRLKSSLYWVYDIEFTPKGRRIVLDWNNHKVREILPDDTFTTIMGTDFVGDGPDDLSDLTAAGAAPLTVNLNHPTDVQEFPNGDIMVMCWHNHKIRVADAVTGRVRVLMGSTPGGFPLPGDGVKASVAKVNQPPHGVLDPNGNLFFIDQRNERIRVIYDFATQRENGIVQTVVGTGQVVGTGGTFNGDNIALQTAVNFPAGGNPEPSGGLALAADGTLYFSDTLNHRIRKVQFTSPDFTSGVVTTIAGNGTAAFSGDGGPAQDAEINYPEDMEIGPDGNLYFADADNNRIRSIDLMNTGFIQTVAGSGINGYDGDGGPAPQAKLNRPFGVAFDAAGDLYVADTFNSRLRKVKLTATP